MSFFSIRSKIKSASSRKPSNTSSSTKPLYLCQPYVHSVLVKGNFVPIVQLPSHMDKDEWLAANAFDFFQYITMFYGTIAEFCTVKDCSTMACGPGFDYPWTDAQKRTTKVAAPLYVDYTTTWIQGVFDDSNQFPTKSGQPFPKDHISTLKLIFKHLFRVLAHLYYCHYTQFLHLNQEPHLNTLFAHFVSFCKTFDLLERKDMDALRPLITEFESQQLC